MALISHVESEFELVKNFVNKINLFNSAKILFCSEEP